MYGLWCAHSIVNLHPVKQRHWRAQTVLENWSKAHLEAILFSTFSLKFPYFFVYTISLTSIFFFCSVVSRAVHVWVSKKKCMFDTWSYGPQKLRRTFTNDAYSVFEISGHAPTHRRKDLDLFHQHPSVLFCPEIRIQWGAKETLLSHNMGSEEAYKQAREQQHSLYTKGATTQLMSQ